jgi:hypothetical protein
LSKKVPEDVRAFAEPQQNSRQEDWHTLTFFFTFRVSKKSYPKHSVSLLLKPVISMNKPDMTSEPRPRWTMARAILTGSASR